jgi:hypothetical protein
MKNPAIDDATHCRFGNVQRNKKMKKGEIIKHQVSSN